MIFAKLMMCIWMMWNNNFLLHNLTTLPLSCSCNMLCNFHCTAFFCLSLVMGKMIFGELISNFVYFLDYWPVFKGSVNIHI